MVVALQNSMHVYFLYFNIQVSFAVSYEMNQSEAQIQTDVSCNSVYFVDIMIYFYFF